MMDLMVLFLELLVTVMILVTKALCLVKLSFLFGVKSTGLVILTCLELLRAAMHLHLYIIWRLIFWNLALILLPTRVLTALQKERLLEMHFHEMQAELENLLLDRKELEEQLQLAIREHRMMEVMLAELEEEHDLAIVKIELLEGEEEATEIVNMEKEIKEEELEELSKRLVVPLELQDVKDENHKLKEVQGKALWNFRREVDKGSSQITHDADKYPISYGIPSWGSGYSESGITLQDLLAHKDVLGDESKSMNETLGLMEGPKASGVIHSFRPGMLSKTSYMNEAVKQQRDIALSQSLFSAILSLLVGVIIWEAEGPCIPLVVALFIVVGISLKSVFQYFSINNKHASDAVALLSFNWFILGTLTYPTLPIVAQFCGPLVLSLLGRIVRLFGFSI